MKILVLTSIRSEYDLMTPLLFLLKDDIEIQLKLLVGGAHTSSTFGHTVDGIYHDNFEILLEIESLIDANSKSGRLKSASVLLLSAIDPVRSFAPDLIIYAGDREEVMIGALLGAYLGIPTLHLYGGDHATDGHVDNPVRHAVSKLSTVHFVSTDEHQNRLLKLGEPQSRIFNIGSIALDKFNTFNSIADIEERLSGKKITKPIALVIYHPISDEEMPCSEVMNNILEVLYHDGYYTFVGLPNTDPGNLEIRDIIRRAVTKFDDLTVYGSLSRDEFLSLFSKCDVIVGNSSAGLLEAASLKKPCINVGNRQRGRLCGQNVVFSSGSKNAINKSLQRIKDSQFSAKLTNLINPYGDGKSAQKAYQLIKSIDFANKLLKSEDPLNV